MDDRYEQAAMEHSIAIAKLADKMAEMNETAAGLAGVSKSDKILQSLRDSHSIISQVLQSLEDARSGRNSL